MKKLLCILTVSIGLTGCGDALLEEASTNDNCLSSSFGSGVPDWIANNFDCVQVTSDGTYYTFTTNDVPEHKSAYFDTDHENYTSEMPSGRSVNPNQIGEQNYVFTIPVNPTAGAGVATDMNAIGVATDGVVFFNNQAASPDTLEDEVETLDTANGHPTDVGAYHYHIEPVEITDDDTNLIGVLRDGFPVFGQKCPATNTYPSDLDTKNGHTANTGISGLGTIYHYHVADMAGDSVSTAVITDTYNGTPGSMTNN